MGFLRKRRSQPDTNAQPPREPDDDNSAGVGYNPHRDEHLYWLTDEGYIIAQDVTCQHEYVQSRVCPECGSTLVVMAHLNRSGQGLSEIVAFCPHCRTRMTFIFDISNAVYQAWWADQLGPLYIEQYDGPPREPSQPA